MRREKRMKRIIACHVIALLIAVWPVTAMAQNLTPYRSIAFTQIVAGGGFDSLINLTNRGTNPYNGTLYLFKSSATNQPWSPTINGTPVTNGAYPFTINAGQTITLDITGDSIAAGFGQVIAADTSASGILDGTLTYYIKSGTSVTDSVGVLPSSELMTTTIPFDNFSTIALGLVNLNPFGTTLHLKLYNDTGAKVAQIDPQFGSMQQMSGYLSGPKGFFPSATITRGRLDIQGDNYFIGTALTQQPPAPGTAVGQYSSLPLLPSPKTYTYVRSGGGQPTMTGELYMFVEGNSYQGYVHDLTSGGSPVNNPISYIQGHMISDPSGNPALTIYNTGQTQGQEYILYINIDPFSLSSQNVSGTWLGILTTGGPLGQVGAVPASGTMTMTATN
jgi:hypothetical protein